MKVPSTGKLREEIGTLLWRINMERLASYISSLLCFYASIKSMPIDIVFDSSHLNKIIPLKTRAVNSFTVLPGHISWRRRVHTFRITRHA